MIWYQDADGDGFGDPEAEVEACEPPEGTVAEAGDCDDDDPAVFPDALELLNGMDDDCDGAVDLIYGAEADGWFAKVKIADTSAYEALMDRAAYDAFLETL